MKRLLILAVIASFTCFGTMYAKTITVCNTCEVKTIKQAIELAEDYDTILIKKGTYKEFDIIVDKPLTIIGENYPVVDGELKGEIIKITSDNVTIDGEKSSKTVGVLLPSNLVSLIPKSAAKS